MPEAVAVDASPLILLSRAKHLDLLKVLGCQILVPEAVRQEVSQKGRQDVTVCALNKKSWLRPVSSVVIRSDILGWELGAGESAVLAWAVEHERTAAMLDDRDARRCAESLKIPVLGTAGLVLIAKRKGVITAARPVLEKLVSVGMYLSPVTLTRLLQKVGE